MPLTVHNQSFLTVQTITGPWITDVTDPVRDGLSCTITGANLSSVTSVHIGGTEQTIDSQSNTEIIFTADVGDLPYGTASVSIDDNSGGSHSRATQVNPLAGRDYVTVSGYPPPEGQKSILDDFDDVEAGDQIEYATTSSQEETVEVFQDGTFTIDDGDPQSFQYRLWDATDGQWSDFALVQINMTLRTPDARRIAVPSREFSINMPP